MRRVRVIMILIAVLCAVAAAALLFVRPWTAAPDEPAQAIVTRWAKVERWAELPDVKLGIVTSLSKRIDQDDAQNSAELRRDPATRVDRASLHPQSRSAIDELVQWSEDEAGFGSKRCTSMTDSPVELLELANLALMSAELRPDDPQVHAALVLARRLRREGTLLDFAAGASLSRQVLGWARAHLIVPDGLFDEERPRVSEAFATIARERWCSVVRFGSRSLEDTRRQWDETAEAMKMLGLQPPPGESAIWTLRFTTVAREMEMMRQYFGRELEMLARHRGDLKELATAWKMPEESSLPKSFAVRAGAGVAPRVIEQFEELLEELSRFEREIQP